MPAPGEPSALPAAAADQPGAAPAEERALASALLPLTGDGALQAELLRGMGEAAVESADDEL